MSTRTTFRPGSAMALALAGMLAAFSPAAAAPGGASCQNTGSFARWLDGFKRDAVNAGISQRTVNTALRDVRLDPGVIASDRRQRVFSQTFLKFAGRMVEGYRLKRGRGLIQKNAATFNRIERQFGVPAEVLTSFWGLETDFGANIGDMPTLTSLATLAYDCRRPELFHEELMAALKIVERGDLRPDQMVGPWAGEMGQTQFLASHYYNYGVDFDGDGRRDLLRSSPDALASAANYLKSLGWRAGEPWLQEVEVPRSIPWEQADIAIKLPRRQWAQWGVRLRGGRSLPSDNLGASLLLPMGHTGPAFLAYHNFDLFTEWNNSLVYATTAAYFATRLQGAPPLRQSDADIPSLGYNEIRQLQQLLVARGYDVGKVDGIIGSNTRASVKAAQSRLGLPADSWPTPALLSALAGRGTAPSGGAIRTGQNR